MLQIDYLDSLYTWKVEAEKRLEEVLELRENALYHKDTEDYERAIHEIKSAESNVNLLKNSIKLYLSLHKSI